MRNISKYLTTTICIAATLGAVTLSYYTGRNHAEVEAYSIGYEDGLKDSEPATAVKVALMVNEQWELYIKHYCVDVNEETAATLLSPEKLKVTSLQMCIWSKNGGKQ